MKKGKKLEIRNARSDDIEGIVKLVQKVYTEMPSYNAAMVRSHLNHFREGVFVALFEGQVVGYTVSFRIGEVALKPHTWAEICGGGLASRHDPEGQYLYGMEVCVDPDRRGYRIGQRFYDQRKKLCQELGLKGIVFGGRIPTYQRRRRKFASIDDYIEAVRSGQARDPVLSFQLRNGFEVLGAIKGYLTVDEPSGGYGVHLIWHNPMIDRDAAPESENNASNFSLPDTVRVATVQYQQRKVSSFDEFIGLVEYFVNTAADYRADFVLFPELFSVQLLSLEDQQINALESIEALSRHTPELLDRLREMSIRYNINIIGGSHPTLSQSGRVENISYVFLRDGSVYHQPKLHPTPTEVYWWNIEGGNRLESIDTDCGPIGVLIGYDSVFPELSRYLVDQGVKMIFVPFYADERQNYLRMRYCCQARAVENQCYVIMSGNCGNLPGVANMDIQYAQSCILTPCDFSFARDGVAADTTPNVETVALADLRLDSLTLTRNNGTVKNLKERRHDLYSVTWHEPKE